MNIPDEIMITLIVMLLNIPDEIMITLIVMLLGYISGRLIEFSIKNCRSLHKNTQKEQKEAKN